MAGSYP